MSSFQDLRVHNNSEAEASSNVTRNARNLFGLLPQDFCERKKPSILKKTTSNVLSVLLINEKDDI